MALLLKTNPIKEEPLVDVAKNRVAQLLLVNGTASCEITSALPCTTSKTPSKKQIEAIPKTKLAILDLMKL